MNDQERLYRGYSNGEMVYSEPKSDKSFWRWVSYDSDTIVMDFTGFRDDNKERIFDGDILKIRKKLSNEKPFLIKVVWSSSKGMWKAEVHPPSLTLNAPLYEICNSQFEVIKMGNVYQNS